MTIYPIPSQNCKKIFNSNTFPRFFFQIAQKLPAPKIFSRHRKVPNRHFPANPPLLVTLCIVWKKTAEAGWSKHNTRNTEWWNSLAVRQVKILINSNQNNQKVSAKSKQSGLPDIFWFLKPISFSKIEYFYKEFMICYNTSLITFWKRAQCQPASSVAISGNISPNPWFWTYMWRNWRFLGCSIWCSKMKRWDENQLLLSLKNFKL